MSEQEQTDAPLKPFYMVVSYTDTIKASVILEAPSLETALELVNKSAPMGVKDFQIITSKEMSEDEFKEFIATGIPPAEVKPTLN